MKNGNDDLVSLHRLIPNKMQAHATNTRTDRSYIHADLSRRSTITLRLSDNKWLLRSKSKFEALKPIVATTARWHNVKGYEYTIVVDRPPRPSFTRPCKASRYEWSSATSPMPSKSTPASVATSNSERSKLASFSTVTSLYPTHGATP